MARQRQQRQQESTMRAGSLLASEQLFRLIYLPLINLIKRRSKRTIISLKLGGDKISTQFSDSFARIPGRESALRCVGLFISPEKSAGYRTFS